MNNPVAVYARIWVPIPERGAGSRRALDIKVGSFCDLRYLTPSNSDDIPAFRAFHVIVENICALRRVGLVIEEILVGTIEPYQSGDSTGVRESLLSLLSFPEFRQYLVEQKSLYDVPKFLSA